MPVLRVKMRVTEVVHDKNLNGETDQQRVTLCAVHPGNAQWSRWTPTAKVQICINNPEAFGKLDGCEFFVDFTPVDE